MIFLFPSADLQQQYAHSPRSIPGIDPEYDARSLQTAVVMHAQSVESVGWVLLMSYNLVMAQINKYSVNLIVLFLYFHASNVIVAL